jgi:VanZ family protein
LFGAALACLIWMGFFRRRKDRILLLACLSVCVLVVRGLAPFNFTRDASHFYWIPFAPSLSYEHAAAAVVLFRKSFVYGVSIWLLTEAGCRIGSATVSIAALLAAIEVAQIYLPSRTAEMTDPLLTLIIGLMLWKAGTRRPPAYPGLTTSANSHRG